MLVRDGFRSPVALTPHEPVVLDVIESLDEQDADRSLQREERHAPSSPKYGHGGIDGAQGHRIPEHPIVRTDDPSILPAQSLALQTPRTTKTTEDRPRQKRIE